MRGSKTSKSQKTMIFLIGGLLLVSVLYLFRLGYYGFHNRDEERFALAAQEMLQKKDWLTPTLRGAPLTTKPILFYLLILLPSYWVGGVTEFTTKLPSALAAIICLGITYDFAQRMWNQRAGIISALVLATSYGFSHQARIAQVDMVLTLLITLSLYSFYRGLKAPEKTKRRYYLLGYTSMGLATLTKGPLGFFLPAIVLLIYLTLNKELGRWKEMEPIRGPLILLAVIMPWFLYLHLYKGSGLLMARRIFYQENIIRYRTLSKDIKPIYYYLPVLMGGLSYWSLILPIAVGSTLSKTATKDEYLLLVWLGFTILLFSLTPFKRDHYITPLYPAAALLIGRSWDLVLSTDCPPPFVSLIGWSLKVIFLLVLLLAPSYAIYVALRFPERLNLLFIAYLLFLLLTGYIVAISYDHKPCWSLSLICLQLYLFNLLLVNQAFPHPSGKTHQSFKLLAQRLMSVIQPEEEIISYKFWKPGLDFYLKRPIAQINDLDSLIQQLKRRVRIYCLLNHKLYQRIKPLLNQHWVIGQGLYGHRRLVVISNRLRPVLPP